MAKYCFFICSSRWLFLNWNRHCSYILIRLLFADIFLLKLATDSSDFIINLLLSCTYCRRGFFFRFGDLGFSPFLMKFRLSLLKSNLVLSIKSKFANLWEYCCKYGSLSSSFWFLFLLLVFWCIYNEREQLFFSFYLRNLFFIDPNDFGFRSVLGSKVWYSGNPECFHGPISSYFSFYS